MVLRDDEGPVTLWHGAGEGGMGGICSHQSGDCQAREGATGLYNSMDHVPVQQVEL